LIPILVTSGKGGVGKSTVAANLALAMALRGLRVSVLDADLMDPVLHLLFKVNKEDLRESGKRLQPYKVDIDGLEVEFMGLGPFMPRGVGVALSYEKTTDLIITFLKFVRWTGDYLIIDTPPGCLPAGTLVLTKRGVVPIERVQIGDYIYSYPIGDFARPFVRVAGVWKRVKVVVRRGVDKVYKIVAGGKTIYATANHPFLRYSFGMIWWVPLERLQPEHRVVTVNYVPFGEPMRLPHSPILRIEHTNEDFMRLVGYFVGDGCIINEKTRGIKPYRVLFSDPKPEMRRKYIEIMTRVFKVSEEDIYIDKAGVNFGILSTEVAELFTKLGLARKSKEREVPSWVFTLPPDQRIAFLEGFIDADGSRRLKTDTKSSIVKHEHEVWSVYSANRNLIEQLHLLASISGFHPTKVMHRARKVVFPDGHEVVSEEWWFEIRPSTYSIEPFRISVISEIEPAGEAEVYDIIVDDDEVHNFIANGIVVHNSIDINVRLLKELEGRARAVLVGEPHIFALEDNLRMLDLLRFYDVDVRALVLNKYNLFREDVVRVAETEYSKLGLRMFKVPWDPELQTTFKPDLFMELVRAVVA